MHQMGAFEVPTQGEPEVINSEEGNQEEVEQVIDDDQVDDEEGEEEIEAQ